MRKMASVRLIADIKEIPGADKICAYVIDGWTVVDGIGKYEIGEKVVLCEIDSWIPVTLAPFLRKTEKQRIYNGVDGERLRTIRLRGQLSQGLILPLPDDIANAEIGADLSEQFNIQKWEAEIPVQLAGMVKGNFPSEVKKTDQERIQNVYGRIKRMIEEGVITDEWIVQEKLEGSSMQVAKVHGENHVLSRNLSLKLDQEGNAYVDVAKRDGLLDLLDTIDNQFPVVSLQGELIGPGIQGNIYNLIRPEFRLFDIWNGQRFLSIPEIIRFLEVAAELGFEIDMVPMHGAVVTGVFTSPDSSVAAILAGAEIQSALYPTLAEGQVYKNLRDPNVTFKAISNEYIMRQKD